MLSNNIKEDLNNTRSDLNSLYSKIETSANILQSKINYYNKKIKKFEYEGADGLILISNGPELFRNFYPDYEKELENYNSLVEEYKKTNSSYESKLEDAQRIDKFQKVSSEVYRTEIANPKDPNQWMAGNELYNAKFAGGIYFNPTDVADIDGKPNIDDSFHLANSNVHGILNSGFTEIQNEIHGFGFLDLMKDHTTVKTTRYEVSITITIPNIDSITITKTVAINNSQGDSLSNPYAITNNLSVSDIYNISNSFGVDIRNVTAISFLDIAIKNLTNGREFSFSKMDARNFLAASLMTTVKNVVSENLTSMVAKALGISNIVGMAIVGTIVSTVVSEMFEVAMGLDNHFGFGGEFQGKLGTNFYSEQKGFLQGIKEVLGELVGNEYSNMATTYSSETIGQLNANYAELTTSTLGEFNRLSRNIDSYNNLSNTISTLNQEVSTFASFKNLESEMDSFNNFGGNNNIGGNFGSSNNPAGGIGASGRGPGGPGGFGGGM